MTIVVSPVAAYIAGRTKNMNTERMDPILRFMCRELIFCADHPLLQPAGGIDICGIDIGDAGFIAAHVYSKMPFKGNCIECIKEMVQMNDPLSGHQVFYPVAAVVGNMYVVDMIRQAYQRQYQVVFQEKLVGGIEVKTQVAPVDRL